MDDASFAFLRRVLETPSPSGYEQPIQRLVREYAAPFADEVTTDRHGNVIAARFPAGRPADAPRVMFAGHCDQIALMVQHVDADGFLYVQPMGGWDVPILLGQPLTVWGKAGPLPAVCGRKAIHLMTPEERAKVPPFQDLWVDVGAKDKADALTLVRPGDTVTFALGLRQLRHDLLTAPGLDDKVGLWVVMEALRQLRGRELAAGVYSVSTVAEEIGLRGATTATYSINPTAGVAVDVCHATDTPNSDKKMVGDIKCGGGPVLARGPNVNPRVFELLDETAAKHDIPVQYAGGPRAASNDGNVMQISREGVAVGLIGLPCRYMHTAVEVVHRADLDRTARLLAEFAAAVGPGTDFVP